MGKKSRMKQERHAPTTAENMLAGVLLARAAHQHKEQERQITEALVLEQEQYRIDRINALPFSHSDNHHKIDLTFGPLLVWIDELVDVGYDTLPNGTAIIQPVKDQEEWYPAVDAFLAVCDTFVLIANDLVLADKTGGLRQFAKKIDCVMPMFQEDVDAARSSIDWMKSTTRHLTPNQFSEYSVTIQIRAKMAEMCDERKAA